MDYQTQQYRLLPGLATCYSLLFTAFNFRNVLAVIQKETNNLQNVPRNTLAKVNGYFTINPFKVKFFSI
jgi:hypothetical protein